VSARGGGGKGGIKGGGSREISPSHSAPPPVPRLTQRWAALGQRAAADDPLPCDEAAGGAEVTAEVLQEVTLPPPHHLSPRPWPIRLSVCLPGRRSACLPFAKPAECLPVLRVVVSISQPSNFIYIERALARLRVRGLARLWHRNGIRSHPCDGRGLCRMIDVMPGDAQSNQLPPPPQILERQTLRGLAAQTLEVLDHVAAAAAAPAPTAATSGDGAADPKAATAAGPAKAARERGVRVAVALHNTLPAPPSPQARSSPSSCGPMRCVPGGGDQWLPKVV